MLKALGIEEEKIEQIIEEHLESVNALKQKAGDAEEIADQLKIVTQERDDLKAKIKENSSASKELEKVKADFEKYKSEVADKETATAKENAVKEYFKSKNIVGGNLEIAMRGCKDEISSITLEEGKITDTKTLDTLISGTYASLVSKTTKQGADTANPPSNNGAKVSTVSKADILSMKDATARHKAIAENPSLFGITLSD